MDNSRSKIDSFRGEYRFLSNFWYAKTTYGGIEFPSSEHAYQAAKSTDERVRRLFLTYEKPGEAKRIGSLIECRADWDEVKVGVMREVLKSKFSDIRLMKKLLATGDAELIEGNNWGDTFFGVCNGVGENWLGKLLMGLREKQKTINKIKAYHKMKKGRSEIINDR